MTRPLSDTDALSSTNIGQRVSKQFRNAYKDQVATEKETEFWRELTRLTSSRYPDRPRLELCHYLLEAVESEELRKTKIGDLSYVRYIRTLDDQLENLEQCTAKLFKILTILKRVKSVTKQHRLLRDYKAHYPKLKSLASIGIILYRTYDESHFLNWLEPLSSTIQKLLQQDIDALGSEYAKFHAQPDPFDLRLEEMLGDEGVVLTKRKYRLGFNQLLPKTQELIHQAFDLLKPLTVHPKTMARQADRGKRISLITDLLLLLNFQGMNPYATTTNPLNDRRVLDSEEKSQRKGLYDRVRRLESPERGRAH